MQSIQDLECGRMQCGSEAQIGAAASVPQTAKIWFDQRLGEVCRPYEIPGRQNPQHDN